LTVKCDQRRGEIEIFDGAEPVAAHQLAPKGQRVIVEDHIAELRGPRWDRVRSRRVVKPQPSPAASGAQLVAWPQVPVIQRPMVDYLNLIEEVAQ
jgi:hypothetical protein